MQTTDSKDSRSARPDLPTPYDDARQSAALDISRHRKLHIQWLPNGRCRAMVGGPGIHLALSTLDYPDPVEALEAAEQHLQEAEVRQQETSARYLLSALEAGVYVPYPELTEDGTIAWQVLRVKDKMVMGKYGGLTPALVEIADLGQKRK